MKVSQVLKQLQDLPPDSEVLFEMWTPEDVFAQAKEMGYSFTDSMSEEVLSNMEHNADASLGHNWEEMSRYIEEVANKYDLPCDDESFSFNDDALNNYDPDAEDPFTGPNADDLHL